MKINFERVLDYFVLASLMIVFCSLFDYSLAFVNSHVAGGDMISHPWISKSLKEQWENGFFWSWNHGWFAGFPFLYFYFYPIYIVAVIFEKLGLPEAVAFKSMVLFVVCLVPFLYYVTLRRLLSIPVAAFATTLGIAIFLNELDSRWGGNFKSLLAGQMSHQFGLVMMVCFFSYIAKKEPNKLGAIFFFTLAILAHVYSGLYAFLILVCFLSAELVKKKNILPYLIGPIISLGLSSFFWIPFLYYRSYTIAPINNSLVDFSEVLRVLQMSQLLYVFLYFGGFALILINILKKNEWVFSAFLFVLTVMSAVGMMFLNGTPLLHIRLPAEIYLLALLTFIVGLQNLKIKKSIEWAVVGLASILVLQSILPSRYLDLKLPKQLRMPVSDITSWWTWNMAGLEIKANSSYVQGVWDFLKLVEDDEGRVAVEYGDYNDFGSPRIFELTPYMTGKPVMEGLLLESSPTYPTYFYISFHFNTSTWWPGFPVTVPDRNVAKGIKYFGLFNVKYFVAAQAQTKSDLDKLKILSVYENPFFKVYLINSDSRIASRIEGLVPMVEAKNPLMMTVSNLPESLDRLVEIRNGISSSSSAIKSASQENIKLIPLEGRWEHQGQSYNILQTGATPENPQKILFKISYFPNWKTNTGEDVRLVTPNLMMVETKNPTLSLTYRAGKPEKISIIVSLLSFAVLIWMKAKKYISKKLFKKIFRRQTIG